MNASQLRALRAGAHVVDTETGADYLVREVVRDSPTRGYVVALCLTHDGGACTISFPALRARYRLR